MLGPYDNFSRSAEIADKFSTIVPGGNHTYSKGADQFPQHGPKIISHAHGAYCWDVDGNRFVDWAMGNRVIILGHNHPTVNEAVRREMERGVNFSRPSLLEYELAEFLVDLLPVAEMVKFGKNGSDVTTAAVKLARAATGRDLIAVCRDHPFFAIHDWFIGTTPMDGGVPEDAAAHTITFPYNQIEAVEQLFDRYPNRIAGVLLEPVKNDAPVDGYLRRLKEVVHSHGAVLIFDEMISGMRFDVRGAHHLYGVYPDLACYGKAIANGYSFSVVAGRRDIMELGGLTHDRKRVFLLSQTHGSESVGLAACRATIEECLRVRINEHINDVGARLVQGVRALARTAGVADHVRVIGFDCNPQILCTRADGSFWPELHTLLHEELVRYGLIIPWTTITLAHQAAELEHTFDGMRMAVERVARTLADGSIEGAFHGDQVKPVFRPFNKCLQSRCGLLDPTAPRARCCDEQAGVRAEAAE